MKLFKRKNIIGKFMNLVPKIYKENMILLGKKEGPLFMHKDDPNGRIMVIIGIGNKEKFINDVIKQLNTITIK